MTRLLLPTLLCLLTACEGPIGLQGDPGVDGTNGDNGDKGDVGDDGTNGTNGENGDCFGRAPVELTGLTGAPAVVYATYPVAVTIDHASPNPLEFSVAGYGVDYVWEGDGFTATVNELNASSQIILATDGCTIDTIVWDPEVQPGTFTLDVVNLNPGTDVDVGLTGESPLDTVSFETRTRLTLPWGTWGFDVSRDGTALATTAAEAYEPGTNHVFFLHPDAGALSVQQIAADLSDSTDPSAQVRLTAVHATDGVPSVDVYDKFSSTLLFDDLLFGTNATFEDAGIGELGLAVDLDDDATTDLDLARLDTTDLVNDHVFAAAYLTDVGGSRVYALGVGNDFDSVADLNVRYDSAPGLVIVSRGATLTDTVTVTDCPNPAKIQVEVDITHSYRSDVRISLTDNASGEADLWDKGFDSDDDVRGLFDASGGIDYTGKGDEAAFTASDLSDYVGVDANGDWTLNVWDDVSGDDGLWNSWSLILECAL